MKNYPEPAGRPVRILYTNWQGETAWRTVYPRHCWYGTTEWHLRPQWFMHALDAEKGESRDFAMNDIKEWQCP